MYQIPSLTVDAILCLLEGVVLVKRKNDPFRGMWALPGGFVDYGESVERAVIREVMEETSLQVRDLRQFHVYSEPDRDPRRHTVSVVFTAEGIGEPNAQDDAAEIAVFPWDSLPESLAFDHQKILSDFLESHPK